MTYRFIDLKRKVRALRTQCQLITGGGNPRDSATENKPPYQGKGEKVW